MQPKVSVIIACYNGADVIGKAIESALGQSEPSIEVVVVNDGSADGSRSVVEGYFNDGRVRLIEHETNKGISAARNSGIEAAQGTYVGFLDQDDLWYPNRVSNALEVFDQDKNGSIGIVFGLEETRRLDTGELLRGRLPPPQNVNALNRTEFLCELLQCNFIPTAAALFRRTCFEQLGPLDETIKSGIDDFEMFIRVARKFDVRHVDEIQAIRHLHGDNFTKLQRMMPDAIKLLERVAAEEPAVAKVAHRSRSHYLYLMSREQHANRKFFASAKLLVRAIRWHPTDPKCWLALVLTLTGPVGHALMSGKHDQQDMRVRS